MSFTVYKSSAGSGKTYTLVKEHLKIILQKPSDFRSILAVTFTNKAANEMKERLISNLQELASDNPDEKSKIIKYLLPELQKETALSVEEIKRNAEKSLALILHNYSDFAISTIDSFVHKIVKTFAYDLHLPLNFEVELDADQLLSDAISMLINRVGVDDELTELLLRFTEAKADDETDWHIENDLMRLAKTLMNENSQNYVESLETLSFPDFKLLTKQILSFTKNFKKQLNDLAAKAIVLIDENNIDVNSFYYGKSGIGQYFLKLSKPANEDFKPNTRVLKTIEDDIWYGAKTEASQKSSIDGIKEKLQNIYSEIMNLLAEHFKKYQLYKILYAQIYPLAVLSEIKKLLSEIKNENNIIHISEFNRQISKIVFSEPVPFIYERLGEKYKHFLIDEFQDTSVLQWQNLIPLIDNSLSEGHFNMIVGDGKQAIYRWRNGEVEQFAKLPVIHEKDNLPLADERENNLKRNYREEILGNNFRSKKEIVAFNNSFFNCISAFLPEEYKGIYDAHEQNYNDNNSGGYVQVEFVEKDTQASVDPLLLSLKKTVDELQSNGNPLSDIAILCRTNVVAQKCAAFLMENNIPVLSSESLLLSASAEIKFIISFIRYLMNPTDKIHLGAVLQYLIEHEIIKEKSLVQIFDQLSEESGQTDLKSYLKSYGFDYSSSQLLGLPIYDLLEKIIRIFKLDEQLDPYIQFFFDAALKFSLKGKTNLTDFLEFWENEQSKESVIIPEGMKAIRLLTIHKSKGLEFPIVIYPFANEVVRKGIDHKWLALKDDALASLETAYLPIKKALEDTIYKDEYEKEMAKSLLDLINLLYVAFTRPVEQLYVISNQPLVSKSEVWDVPKLIKAYLEKEGCWDEKKELYTFGKRETKKSETNIPDEVYKLREFNSVDWRNNLMISTSAPELWNMEEPEQNREKGNLMHLLLSQIYHIDQLQDVVKKNLDQGIIAIEHETEITETLNQMLNHPDIKPYFEKDLRIETEAEILLETGLTIRPDRLILGEEKATIIDYKTGRPSDKHKKQLDFYEKALLSMGYKSVEKVLIYLEEEISLVKW